MDPRLLKSNRNLVRLNLSRVRIPEPTNRIYKQECCVSFETPGSEGGLFVNVATCLAFVKDYQTRKVVPEDRPLKKPTHLAIGVDGGFDNNEPEYEETHNTVILPDYVTLPFPSVELPEKVRSAVDAIIMTEGAERKEQLDNRLTMVLFHHPGGNVPSVTKKIICG
ncbi:Ubiquitin carboxyl-terminal hydrolase [Salix suchowensis]|nr:Ubiquitin carboxyl-terminal hydrolase [Salix suchowensis]